MLWANLLRDKGTHPTTRKPFLITALQEDSELKSAIDGFVKNITDCNTPGSKKIINANLDLLF